MASHDKNLSTSCLNSSTSCLKKYIYIIYSLRCITWDHCLEPPNILQYKGVVSWVSFKVYSVIVNPTFCVGSCSGPYGWCHLKVDMVIRSCDVKHEQLFTLWCVGGAALWAWSFICSKCLSLQIGIYVSSNWLVGVKLHGL